MIMNTNLGDLKTLYNQNKRRRQHRIGRQQLKSGILNTTYWPERELKDINFIMHVEILR